jgi:hypothetical protein
MSLNAISRKSRGNNNDAKAWATTKLQAAAIQSFERSGTDKP